MPAAADVSLDDPVSCVAGVGPARVGILAQAGIETVEDLLLYLPFRYEDRASFVPIATVEPGKVNAVCAVIERLRVSGRPRQRRTLATVRDDSGTIDVVWFRQPYVAKALEKGDTVWLHGTVGLHEEAAQFTNPIFEKVAGAAAGDAGADKAPAAAELPRGLHSGRLVPIYRRIGALTPGLLRRLIDAALETVDSIDESLPPVTVETLALLDRDSALRGIHRPPDDADPRAWNAALSAAHKRLICEEFLTLQTGLQMQRPGSGRGGGGIAIELSPAVVERARAELPFELTKGQADALDIIVADMVKDEPMHRLLQGDVGCGKTAVVGCAMIAAAVAGVQAVLMAPTEILARQHAHSLAPWAAALGVRLECLTGSTAAAERAPILGDLVSGDLPLLVGTHALIEPTVKFKKLGLAVIDEQHRFGVRQRAALRAQGEPPPDLLVMTATPIPRTLALTVYGDLDTCSIRDMPPGRRGIRSAVVSAERWPAVVKLLHETTSRGEQAYVVAPRIEEGDDDLTAAVRLQRDLRKQIQGVEIGLLHGGQSHDERAATMRRFIAGEIGVLAATTVIEVGVDVANATLMVVGHAERFGLAQLHQLRGRVGRGAAQSRCVFIAHEPLSRMARARLDVLCESNDGFRLAEEDLLLRGPGEVLGTRQAGIAGLRVGDPFRDHEWLEMTRAEAKRLARATDAESVAYRRGVMRHWRRRFAVRHAG